MATGAVAAATATPLSTLPSSHARRKPVVVSSSMSSLLPTNPRGRSRLFVVNPLLRPSSFSAWIGLKHLDVYVWRSERRGRCRGRMVYASLFGVGAPEALVIGVVALLVFGPKGLAEVARNLGKTFRAFQPTIRELQDVSREFRSTLEREIGLDEVQSSSTGSVTPSSVTDKPKTPVDSNGAQSTKKPYTSEDFLRQTREKMVKSTTASQTQEASSQVQIQAAEGSTTIKAPAGSATPLTSEKYAASDEATPEDVAATNSPGDSTTSEASPVTSQEATADSAVSITDKDRNSKEGAADS